MKPEDILPEDTNYALYEGKQIRKGTIAAFAANAKIWTNLDESAERKALAERNLLSLAPDLKAIGIFDVFEIRSEALRHLIERHI